MFIAYGVDKCHPDDFDLDLIEFREKVENNVLIKGSALRNVL